MATRPPKFLILRHTQPLALVVLFLLSPASLVADGLFGRCVLGIKALIGDTSRFVRSIIPQKVLNLHNPLTITSGKLHIILSKTDSRHFSLGIENHGKTALPNDNLTGFDLISVAQTAGTDSGIWHLDVRFNQQSNLEISLPESIPPQQAARFEAQLIRRFNELKNPRTARMSRESTVGLQTTAATAKNSEASGFDTFEAAKRALGLNPINHGEVPTVAKDWNAFDPALQVSKENGMAILTVDTRYYTKYSPANRDTEAFLEVRKYPMQPTALGDTFVVFYRQSPMQRSNSNVESFAVFASREAADSFARTHRFVLHQITGKMEAPSSHYPSIRAKESLSNSSPRFITEEHEGRSHEPDRPHTRREISIEE